MAQPDRDWTLAIQKCVTEGECRLCTAGSPDPAHVMGRKHDPPARYPFEGGKRRVLPASIIPLCRPCHTAYDGHELPILHVLTAVEIARAVLDAGGMIPMLHRTLAVSHSRSLEDRLVHYLFEAQPVDRALGLIP